MRRSKPLRVLLLALCLPVALAACVPSPVAWDAEVERSDGAVADSLTVVFDGGMSPRLVARSDDRGATWGPAVTADSTDVGRTGCARHAPFVSVDSISGYVHVVHHLVGREGAGIFFAHSMDGSALFHEPVPIVYGDRPEAAAVASSGDTVAVAFEDRNSRLPRLGLALSMTQGHIFERRTAVSDETGEARTPRVAVRGGRIVVAWTATQRGGALPRTSIRSGTIQPLQER